jgi:hypothetical protein
MTAYKQYIIDELAKLQFDYAECKIEMDEFISSITRLGVDSPGDIEEHKANAEEARYDYKVSKHQDKF